MIESGQENKHKKECCPDFPCHPSTGWLINKCLWPGQYWWCCYRHKSEVVCLLRSSIKNEPGVITFPGGSEGYMACEVKEAFEFNWLIFGFMPWEILHPLPGMSRALGLPCLQAWPASAPADNTEDLYRLFSINLRSASWDSIRLKLLDFIKYFSPSGQNSEAATAAANTHWQGEIIGWNMCWQCSGLALKTINVVKAE